MNKRDFQSTTFGAEALPGGLAEIKESLRSHAAATRQAAPSPAKAPIVGLIALAAHWLRTKASRGP